MVMPVNNTVQTTQPKNVASVKKEQKAKKTSKKQGKDVYTETPIRKLGFLDEAGEALRPVLSLSKNPIVQKLPNFAYIPATLYVAADVADKYKKGVEKGGVKKGVKYAAREAAFQGIVSIAAPMAIIRGVNKITNNLINKASIQEKLSQYFGKAANAVMKDGAIKRTIDKAGVVGKIACAGISLIALTKLMKPVDFITKQAFKHVVDPILGLNKDEEV